MQYATVRRLEIPPGHRILAISDIHANPVFLQKLLQKVGFCADDYLIILGDIVEKGTRSLETLRLLMALARENPRVVILSGNCDDIAFHFADGTGGIDPARYASYFTPLNGRSLTLEMGAAAGIAVRGAEDYPALRAAMQAQFAPELEFLRRLPHILETQRFLFVHGGIPREDRLETLEAWRCMKNDAFLARGYRFDKWCVVGHWPVTLYHPYVPCARPLVLAGRHIASIDGGCSLKLDGQLNALIIPDIGADQFSYVSYDGLPTAVALEAQTASADSVNIRWGRNALDVLARGAEFCRCRHRESGRELDILTDYLYTKDGVTCCEDATDYRLPVAPGDVLSVVRRSTRGTLAKRDGITGWYGGRLRPEDG